MSENARISKFEQLVAWQKARELTKELYKVTSNDRFARDFGLAGQIQRAAVSIMANIAKDLTDLQLKNF